MNDKILSLEKEKAVEAGSKSARRIAKAGETTRRKKNLGLASIASVYIRGLEVVGRRPLSHGLSRKMRGDEGGGQL